MRVDELNVNVIIRNVFAGQLLDDGTDICDAFFGHIRQTTGGKYTAGLGVGRRHKGFDREHDSTEIRHPTVGTENRQSVDAPNALTTVHQQRVIEAMFNHAIGYLLFKWASDSTSTEDMLARGDAGVLFASKVACNANQSTQFTKTQSEFTTATRSSLGLTQNDLDRGAIKMRNRIASLLVHFIVHFLGDEAKQTAAVSLGIAHG